MGGRGPAPATDASKRRGKDRTIPQTTLAAGKLAGPPLQVRRPPYRRATKSWYDAWRRSPQAAQFTGPDWERLQLLAPLVDAVHDPDCSVSQRIAITAELRLNEAKLGATPEDRQRLRWKVPAAGADEPAAAAPSSSRARRTDPRRPAAKKAAKRPPKKAAKKRT